MIRFGEIIRANNHLRKQHFGEIHILGYDLLGNWFLGRRLQPVFDKIYISNDEVHHRYSQSWLQRCQSNVTHKPLSPQTNNNMYKSIVSNCRRWLWPLQEHFNRLKTTLSSYPPAVRAHFLVRHNYFHLVHVTTLELDGTAPSTSVRMSSAFRNAVQRKN